MIQIDLDNRDEGKTFRKWEGCWGGATTERQTESLYIKTQISFITEFLAHELHEVH